MGRLFGVEEAIGRNRDGSTGKEKVWVNEGSMYGEDGDNFIRINIACPRQQLAKGLERLKYAFGQLS